MTTPAGYRLGTWALEHEFTAAVASRVHPAHLALGLAREIPAGVSAARQTAELERQGQAGAVCPARLQGECPLLHPTGAIRPGSKVSALFSLDMRAWT